MCFGLFVDKEENRDGPAGDAQLIGLGRWVTDDVTVVYVNDIYVAPEHRGKGLAKWMLACMNEVLDMMRDLRGTIMIVERNTSTEQLYRRHFAMEELVASDMLLDRKGPGAAE